MQTEMVLDSGAYSAWNSGTKIDIDVYIKFILEHQQYFRWAVCLDKIPSSPGMPVTRADIKASAEESFQNWLFMRSKGAFTVPVYHQGEELDYLDRYLDAGATYVGISLMGEPHASETRSWLDKIFTKITDKEGRPLIQTHAFGITSLPLLFRYPWTTCDSLSWALIGAYGCIVVPKVMNGRQNFLTKPTILKTSIERDGGGRNSFNGLTPAEQEYVNFYLKDQIGLEYSQVQTDYKARAKTVIHFFQQSEKALQNNRFTGRIHNLLDKPSPPRQRCAEMYQLKKTLSFIYVASLSQVQLQMLNDSNVDLRLLSYAYMIGEPNTHEWLSSIKETGLLPIYEAKTRPPRKKKVGPANALYKPLKKGKTKTFEEEDSGSTVEAEALSEFVGRTDQTAPSIT